MGIHGKDVDDGLALLYLLGSKNISLEAITTTFGNSTIEAVHPNTERILKELNISHIPLYKGASSTDDPTRVSQAAHALVELVSERPSELTILSVGSPTNLLGAHNCDPTFFSKVKQIVMMGGIVEPLMINGKIMNELNFASDPEAIQVVLEQTPNLSIITGHVCLDAVFSHQTYQEMTQAGDKAIFKFIEKETKGWIDYIGSIYDTDGFHNWDAVAALYIDHPELFIAEKRPISPCLDKLKSGLLETVNHGTCMVNFPTKIIDIDRFNKTLIDTWANVAYSE
jgi:inosine-uridine nucleoside N-ribohydrolase